MTKPPHHTGERDAMTYHETTQERFDYMLGVLPPTAYYASGFLVGEPVSTRACAVTGCVAYTFRALFDIGGKFLQADEPMTVQEFMAIKEGEVTP